MIEISVIGPVCVRVDGQVVSGLSGKQRQILAILALDAGSAVSKTRLADLLWQGSPPVSSVATLDSYVCVLRRRMGLRAGRTSELATTDAGFRLDASQDVRIDLTAFREMARTAHDAPSAVVLTCAEQALDLVQGELVADVPYADWAVRARDSFRQDVVGLGLRGAQRANALGESARAERLARAATDRDPLCEEAWRQLMLAHWFGGRRASAVAAYGELRGAMAEILGDEPGEDCHQLYLTILRDTSQTGTQSGTDSRFELRALLRLLRQALDCTPGMQAPARDAALSQAAVRALATVS
ncbi:MAG: BTAD domain-containing putative transcriptional regulator [Nocardioidaceae bacterium]